MTNNDLLHALSRHGRHDASCPLFGGPNLPGNTSCTCGYSTVLAQAAKDAMTEAEKGQTEALAIQLDPYHRAEPPHERHESGPNGCREGCPACARERVFADACQRAMDAFSHPQRALPWLETGRQLAPTLDVRARVDEVLRLLGSGHVQEAEVQLADVIETHIFD